jgi:hypothetical protein
MSGFEFLKGTPGQIINTGPAIPTAPPVVVVRPRPVFWTLAPEERPAAEDHEYGSGEALARRGEPGDEKGYAARRFAKRGSLATEIPPVFTHPDLVSESFQNSFLKWA